MVDCHCNSYIAQSKAVLFEDEAQKTSNLKPQTLNPGKASPCAFEGTCSLGFMVLGLVRGLGFSGLVLVFRVVGV